MMNLILTLLVVSVICMIILILMQKSEGGGFASSNTGSMMTTRGFSNILTKGTTFFATVFFTLSLVLAVMTKREAASRKEIFDQGNIDQLVEKYDVIKKDRQKKSKVKKIINSKKNDIPVEPAKK